MKTLSVFVVTLMFTNGVSAQTWEENLEKGAATTERNHLNVPFVKPENWKTPYATPASKGRSLSPSVETTA